MRRPLAGIAAIAIAACTALAACGGDDTGPDTETEGGDTAASSASPPTDDGRKLADWAAVQMLNKNSTGVCEVGTKDLEVRFGEQGWCENDVSFKETPVTLQFVATCVSTDGGSGVAGDGYLYLVEPSITWVDGKDDDNALLVVLTESEGESQVADLRGTTIDVSDMTTGSCTQLDLAEPPEDVSLD